MTFFEGDKRIGIGAAEAILIKERRDWSVKHRLFSSIEKAKGLLGHEPQTEFEDGLKEGARVVC